MVFSNGSVASYDSDKNPKYSVEHLATFKISKETKILRPSDGMKKLIDLGDTSGIWPHKMLISFDPEWVLIMDYETGVSGFTILSGFTNLSVILFECSDISFQ